MGQSMVLWRYLIKGLMKSSLLRCCVEYRILRLYPIRCRSRKLWPALRRNVALYSTNHSTPLISSLTLLFRVERFSIDGTTSDIASSLLHATIPCERLLYCPYSRPATAPPVNHKRTRVAFFSEWRGELSEFARLTSCGGIDSKKRSKSKPDGALVEDRWPSV
jgi:hypothetical protein